MLTDPVLEKKTWSLPESLRYCERIAKNHYENFPVGSLLIPKKIRPYVWVIYAFARSADDFADEDIPETERLPLLNQWQEMLELCYHRRVNHPIFLALGEVVREFKIPKSLLSDLIKAFKMDVVKKQHANFEELLYYCQHSASPVGHLVLYLNRIIDEEVFKLSDYVCTALQLANFWQDVAVDLQKNRIYIPLEDFAKFGYTVEALKQHTCNENFQRLLAFQIQRTKKLFRLATDLPMMVGGRLGLELRCVILGGMSILRAIEKLSYDTLNQRPTISTFQKITILGNALFFYKRKLRAPRRKSNKVALEGSHS